MPDAVGGSATGLVRQRRNLVVLSAAILFASISGVQIKSDINFFGTALHVSKLHYLYLAIWWAWWWFLYRYYQYYKQEGAPKVKDAVDGLLANTVLYRINRNVQLEQSGKASNADGYRTYAGVRRAAAFRLCAQLAIARRGKDGSFRQEHEWEELEFCDFWTDLVKTYFHFLLRRTEFTDYWFPLAFALVVFRYSFCLSAWEGGFSALITLPSQ